jgi:hypothetical protein
MTSMFEGFDKFQREKIQPLIDFINFVNNFELPGIHGFGGAKTEDQEAAQKAEDDAFQKKVDSWWNDNIFIWRKKSSAVDDVTQAEADKKAQEGVSNTKALTDGLEKQTKERNEADKKIAEDNRADVAVGVNAPGGGGNQPYPNTPQLPDETDNMGLALNNHNSN